MTRLSIETRKIYDIDASDYLSTLDDLKSRGEQIIRMGEISDQE